jgi:rhombotail lipoprotein
MISEEEQQRMLQKVKEAFAAKPFITSIEVIPSLYLKPRGGFANLEQAASMFNVDVVALLSYDQIQFSDSNALSVLYWTIIGAYIVHGNQYDIHTMLDVSIFDVKSRKLLFRAPGTSQIKGAGSLVSFSERSRASRTEGFDQALSQMIPALNSELDRFKERLKNDESLKQAVKVEYRQGYGGGNLGLMGIAIIFLLMWFGRVTKK